MLNILVNQCAIKVSIFVTTRIEAITKDSSELLMEWRRVRPVLATERTNRLPGEHHFCLASLGIDNNFVIIKRMHAPVFRICLGINCQVHILFNKLYETDGS